MAFASFIAPGEFLFVSFKVAGYAGLTLALPYVLFQLLAFVLPGLTLRERRLIAPAVAGSALLFLAGLAFAWWALVPAALRFLVSYGADVVEPLWSIERYLDFVLLLMLATGLAFQLPVLLLLLGLFGLCAENDVRSLAMGGSWFRSRGAVLLNPRSVCMLLLVGPSRAVSRGGCLVAPTSSQTRNFRRMSASVPRACKWMLRPCLAGLSRVGDQSRTSPAKPRRFTTSRTSAMCSDSCSGHQKDCYSR